MSELKRFDIVGKYADEETMYEFRPDGECYDADEADEVIAKLKTEIEEQKRLRDMALASMPNVLKVMKIIQHQKYKRCLAMAEWCKESLRLMRTYEVTDDYWNLETGHDAEYFCKKGDFYRKCRERWLKIAEKFKEAK